MMFSWVVRSEGGRIRCDFNSLRRWVRKLVRFEPINALITQTDTKSDLPPTTLPLVRYLRDRQTHSAISGTDPCRACHWPGYAFCAGARSSGHFRDVAADQQIIARA
jgi:hypothetical protein